MTFIVAGIYQPGLLKLGDFDATDVIILEWLIKAMHSRKMLKHIENGQELTWIKHSYIRESLPIIKLVSDRSIRRRLTKYVTAGILVSCQIQNTNERGSKSFYGIGDNYDKLIWDRNDEDDTRREDTSDLSSDRPEDTDDLSSDPREDDGVLSSDRSEDTGVPSDSYVNINYSVIKEHTSGPLFVKILKTFEKTGKYINTEPHKTQTAILGLMRKGTLCDPDNPFKPIQDRLEAFIKLKAAKSKFFNNHPITPDRVNSLWDCLTPHIKSKEETLKDERMKRELEEIYGRK